MVRYFASLLRAILQIVTPDAGVRRLVSGSVSASALPITLSVARRKPNGPKQHLPGHMSLGHTSRHHLDGPECQRFVIRTGKDDNQDRASIARICSKASSSFASKVQVNQVELGL